MGSFARDAQQQIISVYTEGLRTVRRVVIWGFGIGVPACDLAEAGPVPDGVRNGDELDQRKGMYERRSQSDEQLDKSVASRIMKEKTAL